MFDVILLRIFHSSLLQIKQYWIYGGSYVMNLTNLMIDLQDNESKHFSVGKT